MPRGFGTTFGAGASDALPLGLYDPGDDRCSYSVWYLRNGDGGGGYGSIFRKGAPIGTSEMIYWYGGAAAGPNLVYVRGNASGTTTAQHLCAVAGGSDASGVWNHALITHDQTSGALTEPAAWFNGVRAGAATLSGDTGRASNSTYNYILGNHEAGTRNWDGMIAHFAKWSGTLLGDAEALALAGGANPLAIQPQHLACYLPLDGVNSPEPDLINFLSQAINGTRLGDARGMPALAPLPARTWSIGRPGTPSLPTRTMSLDAALPAPSLAATMDAAIAITLNATLPAPTLAASLLLGNLATDMPVIGLAADAANRTTAQLAHPGNARADRRVAATDAPTPFTDATAPVGSLAKFAMAQDMAGTSVAMNGGEVVTASSAGYPAMTTLTIAGGPALRLRRVRRWSRALSDPELKGAST